MKYAIVLALLALSSAAALAADKKACDKKQVVATVDGMVCDFCAQGLKKVLMKEEAVENVEIDLTTKHVTIDLKAGQSIADSVVNEKVDWAGYKVSGIAHSCASKG